MFNLFTITHRYTLPVKAHQNPVVVKINLLSFPRPDNA